MQEGNVVPPQWQYNPETPDQQSANEPTQQAGQAPQSGTVQWSASEFMSHEKTSKWYVVLLLSAVAISVLVFVLFRDIVSSITLVVMAILLATVASRKPRTLNYELNDHGITIGEKHYPYANFKSFSVINEGALNSIMLMPIKRFATAVTMYYAPEDEERIAQALSTVLPYEQRQQDPVDKLMQRIRF